MTPCGISRDGRPLKDVPESWKPNSERSLANPLKVKPHVSLSKWWCSSVRKSSFATRPVVFNFTPCFHLYLAPSGVVEVEAYTPTRTPPVRSAGSDKTPSKSIYQEQCDQIWAHHRSRGQNNNSVAQSNDNSPAGRATSNAKFNPFTGAREGGGIAEERARITNQSQEERERQRQTEDALPNQYPPWATHEGEEAALRLKNG